MQSIWGSKKFEMHIIYAIYAMPYIYIFIMKSYSEVTRKNKKVKKITWWTNMKLKTVRYAI